MEHAEIIINKAEIWLGPAKETEPEIQATPAGNFVKLGTGGDDNLGEEGITVSHEQSLSYKRTLGSTGPVKVTRGEEDMKISGVLNDLTAEEYGKIMNNVTASDTAPDSDTGGYRTITLRQGPTVATRALLIRGDWSPYLDGATYKTQYYIPIVVQSANPSPVFNKTDSADLAFEFTALENPDASTEVERFGYFRAQDAAATG